MKITAVSLLIAALFAGPATAQDAAVLAQLKAWDAAAPSPPRPVIQAELAKTAAAIATTGKGCRPSAIEVVEVSPITAAAAVMNGIIAKQLRNAWSVTARYSGCPGTDVFRYALLQLADGGLRALLINEGRSNANLSIMRDTSGQAAAVAFAVVKRADPACAGTDLVMGRTRIVSEAPGLGPMSTAFATPAAGPKSGAFTTCGGRSKCRSPLPPTATAARIPTSPPPRPYCCPGHDRAPASPAPPAGTLLTA